MKTLKFRKHLAQMILNGQKTVTWRLFDDKNLEIGDALQFIEWDTKKVFAEATIVDIQEKKLGEITGPDMLGHERFSDTADMLNHYQDFYRDHQVTMETPVKMVEFKLLEAKPE